MPRDVVAALKAHFQVCEQCRANPLEPCARGLALAAEAEDAMKPGAPAPDCYRLVGFHPTTDDAGDLVLYVMRSTLDIKAEEVRCSVLLLKQIVVSYLAAEIQQQLIAAGFLTVPSNGGTIPGAVRLSPPTTSRSSVEA